MDGLLLGTAVATIVVGGVLILAIVVISVGLLCDSHYNRRERDER